MTKKTNLLLFFLFVIILVVSHECSANEAIERIRMQRSKARVETYIDEGRKLVETGAYFRAIRLLTEALSRGASSEACALRARAYQAVGNVDAALKDFNRVVETTPSDPNCYVQRADAENAIGYYDKAIKDYDYAVQIDPFLIDAYLGRSVAYGSLEQYDLAVRDLELALKMDQNNGEALYNLGVVCMLADMPKAGRDYLNRTLAQNIDPVWKERVSSIMASAPQQSDFEERKGGISGILSDLGKREHVNLASKDNNRITIENESSRSKRRTLPYSSKSRQADDTRNLLAKIGKQDFSGWRSGVYMGMQWRMSFSFSGNTVNWILKLETPSGKQETHHGHGTFFNGAIEISDNTGLRFAGRVTDDLKVVGTLSTADGHNVSIDIPLQE
jgi:tetratricopeptide (TPR) repeat protein